MGELISISGGAKLGGGIDGVAVFSGSLKATLYKKIIYKEGKIMKRKPLLTIVLFLLFVTLCSIHPTITIAAMYDTFTKPRIDPTKWSSYEFVREIQNGKLASEITAYGSRVTNNLNFKNPTSVYYIEADGEVWGQIFILDLI